MSLYEVNNMFYHGAKDWGGRMSATLKIFYLKKIPELLSKGVHVITVKGQLNIT